jgi:hypothetical protein
MSPIYESYQEGSWQTTISQDVIRRCLKDAIARRRTILKYNFEVSGIKATMLKHTLFQ